MVTFKTTKLESDNPNYYKAEAFNIDGELLMSWTIVCNETDNPNDVAAEGYKAAIAPPVILTNT